MASINDLQITIIGAGKSKFGLRLLGIVARVFSIRLEVVCPTKRLLDGAYVVAPHCQHGYNGTCPECAAMQTTPRQ